ncbi:MAG TPA: helix-turn-helix transcriptional regulator [Sphaerochaeta sp.]|nr:helix-turn-helix transcriptional regulator [Sphaerochaeta sp.]
MSAILVVVYLFAFALGMMTLALAIVYRIARKQRWITHFIVCHASLLGCMMLLALQGLSSLVFTGLVVTVIDYTISAVVLAAMTFLIVFVPFFTTMVIAYPWRKPYTLLFYALAACYLALGILRVLFRLPIFTAGMVTIFTFVVGFSLSIVMRNVNSIEHKTARTSALVILIVSASMVPAILLALFIPALQPMLLGIYFIALSITVMTFLYMEFARISRIAAIEPKELRLADVAEWGITEREFDIIRLISDGLTNKEMAAELGISANTVNNHVANIFSKTQVRSRIDLLNLLKQNW